MPFISANICLTSLKPQLLFARSLVIAKHAKLMGRDRVALGRIFFGEEVTHGIDEAMCYGRREGDVFVARKMRVHRLPNSNDVASNEMLWERVLSLLVVGASVLGGSAVLLRMALPPVLHGFP